MKKVLFFLSLSAILLTSCGGGEDLTPFDPNSSQSAIVKKIIETDDSSGSTITNFTYDGNKIVNFVDSDGTSGVFTYVGDNLTRIDYFDGPDLTDSDIFTYNAAGKIIVHLALIHANDYAEREDFTYNSDGTVTYNAFWGTVLEQTNVEGQGKLFFTDGQVSKKETYFDNLVLSSETYVYDSKNNPWKNVIGLNEAYVFLGDVTGIKSNLLTASGTNDPHAIEYIYNPANFPESSIDISAVSGQVSTQYFYE